MAKEAKIMVYTLTHENKYGFSTYVFSSEARRMEAALLLKKQYDFDDESETDFLTADEAFIDEMMPVAITGGANARSNGI
jgi:hypothetical protein